ncbi:hypothetical protein TRAPUB_9498 [Trametes pubescens]|uniref:Uncharacterized protein n=1 Tax=Trametes pubescens TaxID=154538 RepID=A0A1M2W275_TRAPU|nr:hypothetical protein TRAPUB_9498 [Trametes pubescens]
MQIASRSETDWEGDGRELCAGCGAVGGAVRARRISSVRRVRSRGIQWDSDSGSLQ